MGVCAQRNIDLSFMSGNGRFLARVTGEVKGNVTLRKTQYRISDNRDESVHIARNFILGKVYNSRWVLERLQEITSAFRCGNDKEKVSVFSSEYGKNKRM